MLCAGCARDVRLSGKNVPDVQVKPVTMYGMTLDEAATPEQVVFAAMQAMRDDFASPKDREAHLLKQFDLCAANYLRSKNRGGLPDNEFVYNVVYRWTPTVAHYLGDFPADWESARTRLVRRDAKADPSAKDAVEMSEVAMEVRDPGGDPRANAVMLAWLVKDKGLWRVTHFGFELGRRSIRGEAAKPKAGGA